MRMDDIGGARVARTFKMGSEQVKRGRPITLDELRAMPAPNRAALIDKGFIEVWPRGAAEAAGDAERFVINLGFGRYAVVEGRKLHEAALSREAAYALAGKPLPADKAN